MNDQTTSGHDRRFLTALPVNGVGQSLFGISALLVMTVISALGIGPSIPWWVMLVCIVLLVIPLYLLLCRVDRRLCAWWDRQPREKQRTLRSWGGVAGAIWVAGLLIFLVSQYG